MQKIKTLDEKALAKTEFSYLLIVAFVNFLGAYLCTSGLMNVAIPVKNMDNFHAWGAFKNENACIVKSLSVVIFIIPAVCCILYLFPQKKHDIKRRIVNLPFAYSVISVFGWILSFVMISVSFFIFMIQTKRMIWEIYFSFVMLITQTCLLIFTFTFLCLDAIHRKIVLPSYFPNGQISLIEGTKKFSVRMLFRIFFISVSIFPIFYLTSTLYNFSQTYGFKISVGIIIIIVFILILGIVTLINFSNYFLNPLEKLKKATEEIKNLNYSQKVDVVSSDDFGELADNFNDMAGTLNQKTKKISAIQDSIIKGMAVMIESRDNSTGGHINRTSDCVRVFGQRLMETGKYPEITIDFYNSLIKAAPMHDLGKIAVKDAVLQKNGRFTDEEYENMKIHAAEGAHIVENVLNEVDDFQFKQIAINVAHYHHEKWNGTGYPEKISGSNIPLEARIMALADVFDALVSKRCYKDSMSYDDAFSIIRKDSGTHFDPELAEVFLSCRSELIALYESYKA